MSLWQKIRTSSLLMVVPAAALAVLVSVVVSGYEPLVFDPSMFAAPRANAAELATLDAEELEAAKPEGEPAVAQAAVQGALTDGTFTAYAPCGQGNADDWKPYYVGVTVKVQDAKIVSVSDIHGASTGGAGQPALNWDAAENQKYLDWAVSGRDGQAGVAAQLNSPTAVGSVDSVSGATYSSVAIFNAYVGALGQSTGSGAAVGMDAPAADAAETEAPEQSVSVADDDQVSSDKLADGTWTGYAECGIGNEDDWSPYYVGVTVKVKGGKPVKVKSVFGSSEGDEGASALKWDAEENQKYLDWAVNGRERAGKHFEGVKAQIEAALAEGVQPQSIDAVSGATYSSEALFKAYYSALRKSAKAAGSTIDEPDDTKKKQAKPKEKEKSKDKDADAEDDAAEQITGALADGQWTGYAACGVGNEDDWSPYYVGVTITVKDAAVATIDSIFGSSSAEQGDGKLNWSAEENQKYLDWAIGGREKGGVSYAGAKAQIEGALAKGSLPSGLDAVSGATYSTDAIYQAFYAAVTKASEAAGSKVDVPESDPEKPQDPGKADDPDPGASDPIEADADVGALADGEWTGYAACGVGNEDEWSPYYVGVTITVEKGACTGVKAVFGSSTGESGDEALNWNADENARYLDWAINGRTKGGVTFTGAKAQIESALAKGSLPSSVDAVSEATYSTTALFKAFYAALAKSAAAGGAKVEEPENPVVVTPDEEDEQTVAADASTVKLPSIFGDFTDGTYTGYALCGVGNDDGWNPYYLAVDVEMADGKVVKVADARAVVGDEADEIASEYAYESENEVYLRWALQGKNSRSKGVPQKIQDQLDEGSEIIYRPKATDDAPPDAVSGATYSSNAIVLAYANALRDALGLEALTELEMN